VTHPDHRVPLLMKIRGVRHGETGAYRPFEMADDPPDCRDRMCRLVRQRRFRPPGYVGFERHCGARPLYKNGSDRRCHTRARRALVGKIALALAECTPERLTHDIKPRACHVSRQLRGRC